MENYNSLIKGLLRKRFVFFEAPKGDTAPEAKKVSESGQARNLIRQKAINLLKDPNLKGKEREALKKALKDSTNDEVNRGKEEASISAETLLNQLRAHAKKAGKPMFNAYEQKALGGEKGIKQREADQEKKMDAVESAKEGLSDLISNYNAKKGKAEDWGDALTTLYESLDEQNKAYNLALGTFNSWNDGADKNDPMVKEEMKRQAAKMEAAKAKISTLKVLAGNFETKYEDAVTDCNKSATELSAKEDEIIGLEKEAGVTDGTKKTEKPPFKTIMELPGWDAVSKSDVITGQAIPTVQSASPAPIAQRPNQGFGPKV